MAVNDKGIRSGGTAGQGMPSMTAAESGVRKFGTFAGVFVPTVLTILGTIMYLRLGWVVGNAGLLGAVMIILLAHVITISTGLSVASIATNIRVGAGGAFSIISQSLGLEVGGSISVPLYLSQAISTTLYVFGFAEGWMRIFPGSSEPVVVFMTLAIVFTIALISAKLATRIQFIILAIVGFSLFSILLSAFPTTQQPGMVQVPEWIGGFPDGDFWYIFSVFFPAVTGIMAGISLSGNLKDPRRSIPVGTMTAIGITVLIYLLLAVWLARVATPDELITNTTIMVDRAYWGWAILAGLLGATFSSALGSLLAAPRVMQALGAHGVLPRYFAQAARDGEPRRAMLATGVIVLGTTIFALLAGGLNSVAPLITMFFLIAYFVLNGVVLIEQTLDMVSFRPTFAIPRVVPFVGALGCLVVMFLINPIFGMGAILVTLGVYIYLLRRHLNAPWEDVRSGLFLSLANWAVDRVSHMPAAPERTWSPNILIPIRSGKMLAGTYRFLRAIASPQGSIRPLYIAKTLPPEELNHINSLVDAFYRDRIGGRPILLETGDFLEGIHTVMDVLSDTFFRPNMLFLPVRINALLPEADEATLGRLIKHGHEQQLAVILYAQHKLIGLAQEQVINVWMREQGPDWRLGLRLANLDLAVLLAYKVGKNWNGRINLCMVVPDAETRRRAESYLAELMTLARLPADTDKLVFEGAFWSVLPDAPRADLSIFGLQRDPDLAFVERVVETVDATCIFVRDSGNESALA